MALNEKLSPLRGELSRLVAAIADEGEEDCSVESIDQAVGVLLAFKDLVLNEKEKKQTALPEEYVCPISGRVMRDPVVLETGQTYDRAHIIELLLKRGDQRCPKTQKLLSHDTLIPNNLVRGMILRWCEKLEIELPKPAQDFEAVAKTGSERDYCQALLNKMSSVQDQKAAVKELRHLTELLPSYRALCGELPGAIPQLVSLFSQEGAAADPDLQEDLTAIILNISTHDANKKLLGENSNILSALIEAMKSGMKKTRRNAAAALVCLSNLGSNKQLVGESGVFKPLFDILEEGDPLAIHDVVSAMLSLCDVVENRRKAVDEGGVRVILSKIMDHEMVDELLLLLALLSSNQDAIDELLELRAVQCLLSIMKEITNEHSKEHCVAVLYALCLRDRRVLREIRLHEETNGTISKLAESGTSRAKRKANSILDKINRTSAEMPTS